jgi:glycosyltransferase involved in cell wall biosynthesis
MVVTRHLEKLYDVETVIRAFGAVQARYPEATLCIAGTGGEEAALRRLTQELKLHNVVFTGYVPNENLPELYNRSDILLNGSMADNFPASLVEAAAAGLAVISTDVGGIPYLFENEKSALLVPVRDWKAMAEAVIRVLENPDLGSRLTAAALDRCLQYDWKNVSDVLYRVYGFSGTKESAPRASVSAGAGANRKMGREIC